MAIPASIHEGALGVPYTSWSDNLRRSRLEAGQLQLDSVMHASL